MRKNILLPIFLIFALAFSQITIAVLPSEMLDDPVLEERARDISKNLRCLVCNNQNIDDSDAPLAADLRVLVRERLVAGDSNDEVIKYVVDRYGEFVLLNPVFKTHTLILWIGGPVVLLFGLFFIFRTAKKQEKLKPVKNLSDEEKAILKTLDDE